MTHECEMGMIAGTEAKAEADGSFSLTVSVGMIGLCGKPANLRWYNHEGLGIWVCAEHYDELERLTKVRHAVGCRTIINKEIMAQAPVPASEP